MVAAIIPALNEEKTIGTVVSTVRNSGVVDEIIVVSDGSTDRTAEIARAHGATKVISHRNASGKGAAMRDGIRATEAGVILFCDGDLLGFRPHHVRALVAPVVRGEAVMNVGLRDRGAWFFVIEKFLPLISGERALKREVFEKLPAACSVGYMVEIAMNYYCKIHHLAIATIELKGVNIRKKYQKIGWWRGFTGYLTMSRQLLAGAVRLRMFHAQGKL